MIEGGGPAIQMPMPQNMLESEMIGAIKIKDGLFIGDELASTVSRQRSHMLSFISISEAVWKESCSKPEEPF